MNASVRRVPALAGALLFLFGHAAALDVASAVKTDGDSMRGTASNYGDPLPGLNAGELELFATGRETFEEVEDAEDGLGPVFNGTGCAQCHGRPATGGSRDLANGKTTIETRFGTVDGGVFDPMEHKGGSLIQTKGIGVQGQCNFVGETVPPTATRVAGRRTTPLFGLGLVDAVPDESYRDIERQQLLDPDGVRGRVSIVRSPSANADRVGKFGWKAQVASLTDFAGDAYLNEMGITNPFFMNDSCPQGDCSLLACDTVADPEDEGDDLAAFADFMTLLGPPPRGQITPPVRDGEALFQNARCTACHLPRLVTGDSPIPALRNVAFAPYSDFLLHDMGSLGDGIAQNTARGADMRTAPLWGLRDFKVFLHDGRAASVGAAILAHDGEARPSRDRYAAMSQHDKARMHAFLNSL
jgi:CxxC motif-containing protein (DUF1111 family)